jgi:hypothetical protein
MAFSEGRGAWSSLWGVSRKLWASPRAVPSRGFRKEGLSRENSSAFPVLIRSRQEDLKLKANLGYIVSFRPAWGYSETLF